MSAPPGSGGAGAPTIDRLDAAERAFFARQLEAASALDFTSYAELAGRQFRFGYLVEPDPLK